ncbi:UNVERIFIED_CONTAM: hypothetical protein HDU68_005116, partial [Siphonaria sp. JEL0065]
MLAVAALSVLQAHAPTPSTSIRLYAVQIQKYCVEKHPGLSLFCPSQTELTLCGTAFVVDINLDATTGSIHKVKLSYVEKGDQIDDKEGGKFLKAQLLEPTFDGFAASISTLALRDKHTTASLDAFKIQHLLTRDLSKIYSMEVQHALVGSGNISTSPGETWAFGVHPVVAVLLHGHGVFRANSGKLGVGLVYWVGRGDLVAGRDGWDSFVGNESTHLSSFQDVYSVHLSFVEGVGLNVLDSYEEGGYFGTIAVGNESESHITSLNGLGLTFRKSNNPVEVEGTSFALEFNPPIASTLEFKNKLLASLG